MVTVGAIFIMTVNFVIGGHQMTQLHYFGSMADCTAALATTPEPSITSKSCAQSQ